MKPATLPEALQWAAARNEPGAGLRFLDRREQATFLSWPQLFDRAARVAGALREAGIRRDDFVAIILPTSPDFPDAFFGALLAGATPVPLYPPVRLGRLDEYFDRTVKMLQTVGARILLTDARVRRLLGRLAESHPFPLGVHQVQTLREGGASFVDEDVPPDALGLVQFSSGTTGHPKAVALQHDQLLANAGTITDYLLRVTPKGAEPAPAGVSWLPLYHDMGLIGCIFPALLAPGPLTLIPPEAFLSHPAIWLRAISRYGGTISPAPNFAYALCTERIADDDLQSVDLSTWKMALNGAEPVSPTTLRAFAQRFSAYGFDPQALMPVYGLSEMALAVTFSPPGRPTSAPTWSAEAMTDGRAEPAADGTARVSVGRPLPGYEVRIVDAASEVLPERHVGRVQVAGPSRMRGYLGLREQPFDGRWLDTGDLGFLHEGELTITGRAKDLLVIRGRNHAPQDLEAAADLVPGVRTGCSAAVAQITGEGERLLVFAEVRTPAEGLAERVLQSIRGHTGVTPDAVVLLEPGTLPRTSSGKIRRHETLLRHEAGTLLPPQKVTPLRIAGALGRSWLGYLRASSSPDER